MLRAALVLFLLALALPASASWHTFGSNGATAVDFRNAHEGVLSFNDATHLIQIYDNAKLKGVFQAPDVVTGLLIQDSLVAWATIKGNGLYKGTKHWSEWSQTSSRTDLSLVAITPGKLFVYSLGQLYYTTNGTTLTSTIGIPAGDSIVGMDYLTSDILLAVSSSIIYRSTDGGQNWKGVATGVRGCQTIYADRAHGLAYAGADTVRKSSDAGAHWSIIPVPAPFGWNRVGGYVTGAHDCSGTFYIANDTLGVDFQMVRSTDGGKTFEDVGVTPPLVSNQRKSWTFDRGATFWFWDVTTTKGVINLAWSDDGLNGAITDSIASLILATAEPIFDTACGAARPLIVRFRSNVCTPVRLDSIFPVAAIGKIGKAAISRTLQGDTASISLNYLPLADGIDTIALRVTLHGLEWGIREQIDLVAYAFTSTEPAKLAEMQDIDFGTVRTDSMKTLTVRIANVGCNGLRVDSIASTDPTIFSVESPQMPFFIKGDSAINVNVHFAPVASGLNVESIEIGTSVGHRFITVQGTGLRVASCVQEAAREDCFSPNPVSKMLHSSSVTDLILFDQLGRAVFHGVGMDFDVSMLPAGTYFARVKDKLIHITIARP